MDIYFAVMNFVLSGAIGFVGILTLRKVSTPNEVLFALLPLFFAFHQFSEGFVWLGIGQHISPKAAELSEEIFIYFAQGLLPFLIPLSVWLIEKNPRKRTVLSTLVLLGFFLAAYSLYGLSTIPSSVTVVNNVLFYNNLWTANIYDASIYIVTTCGALMLSSSITIQIFGFLNLLGLSVIFIVRPYGFTSLWCLYAAVLSGLLYFYFAERRSAFLAKIKKEREDLRSALQHELGKLHTSVKEKIKIS